MTANVLDATCGARMMWFDKTDPRAISGDQRTETHTLCDGRTLDIAPDVELDFRALPFPDETFRLVVFDPPHLTNVGHSSWLAAKYGRLLPSWQDDITAGFAECFRVLKPEGVLIFKWSEVQVPLADVLACTPERPLFGHTGTNASTYWMAFMKEDNP